MERAIMVILILIMCRCLLSSAFIPLLSFCLNNYASNLLHGEQWFRQYHLRWIRIILKSYLMTRYLLRQRMIFTSGWGFVWTFLISRPVIHSISTSPCSSIASWLAVSLAPTSVKAQWIWWNSVLFPRSRLALGLWFVIDLPHPGLTNPFSRLIVFPSNSKRRKRALKILQELRHRWR